jgi:hypothetical protein
MRVVPQMTNAPLPAHRGLEKDRLDALMYKREVMVVAHAGGDTTAR